MGAIPAIAERHELLVIEDAAQVTMAAHCGRPFGAIVRLGTLSVQETRNITLVWAGGIQA